MRDDDINEADFANHQGKFVLLFYCDIEKSSSLWPLLYQRVEEINTFKVDVDSESSSPLLFKDSGHF